jgi:DNA-binding NarL/FixJ family response regulator
MRQGLGAMIKLEPGMTLVAEADSGRQAIDLARLHKLDVVTMDIGMSDMNGIEATRLIVTEHPKIKIVALSMYSDRKYIREVFRAGARGFLQKDCAFTELVDAVVAIHSGQAFLGKTVTGIVVDDILSVENEPLGNNLSVLSNREIEVLRLMAVGVCTKDIALRMNIGIKTIETHQFRMKKKLGIDHVAGLTRFAIREGLICDGEMLPLP